MKAPSFADAYEVLCLQATDNGRGEVLFGESIQRARKEARPFMVGEEFPSVYLECPLVGDPFMDVTMLYRKLPSGTRINSPAAANTESLLDWCAEGYTEFEDVSFGFELDTKNAELPTAAIHFQPRSHTELVEPFCKAAGEPERAALYLDLASRMPSGWDLSFFGMFRGRPGSPLRVCGYLGGDVLQSATQDPSYLPSVFDHVGFTAYDDVMLQQVRALMSESSEGTDFQLDVYPDGSLGNIFAIDLQFGIEQPASVQENFAQGPASRIMGLLQSWGAADDRWRLGGEAAFARAIPVDLPNGGTARYSFTLMPQWAKARWSATKLQPSKLYLLGKAGILSDAE